MTRAIFFKAVLGVLLLSLIGYWLARQLPLAKPRISPSSENSLANVSPKILGDQEITQRVLALEVERSHLDQTIWARELLAQKHENVFVRLWDNLRTQSDPFEVLENFAFGQLLLGTPSAPSTSGHQIAISHFVPPVRSLGPEAWKELLRGFKAQGLRLDQSEWRHASFSLGPDGIAVSVIEVTLHAVNPTTEERFVVRGKLRVQWRQAADANGDPFPQRMDAVDLELLSRRGETPFHHVVAADLTPEKDERFLEPSLQLYDLDGDGLSEIILARRNRVFWNKGKGTFRPEPLLKHRLASLRTGLFADFDGDGAADFLGVDSQGLALFAGNPQGHFPTPGKRTRFTDRPLLNPFALAAGDVDRDGDLDLWLAQYKVPYQDGQMPTPYYDANDGYPAFLLMNDGRGNFLDHTEQSGLASKRFRRTYSSSFADLDSDGDLDLLVVSDFAGTDLYYNDGKGHFIDVTAEALDESHAFGMAHSFGDYDLDGQLDFLVIGMNSFAANRLDGSAAGPADFAAHNQMRAKMAFGNRMYLRRPAGFKQTLLSAQIARSGWSWGVTTGDFDNDGDEDVYIVNGHISGRSARDYESHFWRHDIYLGGSEDDPVLDGYFRSAQTKYHGAGQSYGGFEKNRLFLNQSGKSFLEAGHLLGVAMEEACRNAVSDDLDGDGKVDLLVTTFQVWPKTQQLLHLFPNFNSEPGNWVGIRLREAGAGFSPVGAKVTLTTSAGIQQRCFVTGDSYRSQHATTAHFGLGQQTRVEQIEIIWPNGQRTTLRGPEINRYHFITPGGK